MHRTPYLISIGALLAVFALSACVTQEEHRGYAIEFAKLDQVKAGASTRDEVFAALGSPSTTSTFGQEKWYYINTKLEDGSLTQPELVGQNTIVVTFNEGGIVESVEQGEGEGRRDIAIAKDKTRTEGQSITVMQQLLGNLGRFNAADQGGQNKVRTPQPGF